MPLVITPNPEYPMLKIGLVIGRFTDAALPGDRIALVLICRRDEAGCALSRASPGWGPFRN